MKADVRHSKEDQVALDDTDPTALARRSYRVAFPPGNHPIQCVVFFPSGIDVRWANGK